MSYAEHYSDDGFWATTKKVAKKAGATVLRPALELYYAMKSPDTAIWAKTVATGALGYLILPMDLVPDPLPIIGFGDDILTMTAALNSLGRYITVEIKNQAKATASKWMGLS